MQILVLGTSNSILRGGYVDALRAQPGVTRLDREGPGGSTSIMLPFFAPDLDLGRYDCVLIDTSINDSAFLGWNALRVGEIADNLRWICDAVIGAGSTPALLCLPNRSHLGGSDPALPTYRQIAQGYGIALYDGYQAIKELAPADELGDLFQDDLHLRPEAAAALAPDILRHCQPVPGLTAQPDAIRFHRIKAHDLGLPVQTRKTSLMQADCAALAEGAALHLPLQPGEVLAGVVYNAGQSTGSLIAQGASGAYVNMRSQYYQKHELVVAARQISPGVAAGADGTAQIFIQRGQPGEAEIIGLVIKSD